MKKTLKLCCVFVLFVLVFCLAGCTKDSNQNNNFSSVVSYTHSVNVLAYAEKGEIPEISYKLGADIENLKSTFKNTIPAYSEVEDLTISEGEKTVWLDGGSVMFCYEKEKLEKGVSVIIAKEEAYGFSLGGVHSKEDIIEIIKDSEYTLNKATSEDVFFLPVIPENCETITLKTGDYLLKFVFIDNFLSAVMLIDPLNWAI